MSSQPAIQVINVSKDFILPKERANSVKSLLTSYGRGNSWKVKEVQAALRNINFEISRGEFFGIVGRNGSGKSTLLKIIANIYQPNKGKVHVYGKLIPFIELGVGFNPELSGKDNIYLNGALFGFKKNQIAEMYDDIVKFAELEDFMDQKLKNYSSGMQVRLAFSLAIKAQGDILLLDEVLAVGDISFQRKCYDYFKQLKRLNKTVIFVTHDMEAVMEYCDKAILIDRHEIKKIGKPNAVAEEYRKIMNPAAKHKPPDSSRVWGDGSSKISNIKIKPSDNKGEIIISYTASFLSNVDDPVFGYGIKDSAGSDVCGGNSHIHKIKSIAKKGDKFDVSWRIANVFGNDKYSVDVAVVYDNLLTVSAWHDKAGWFTNEEINKSHFRIFPPEKIDIKQKAENE